MSTDQNLIKELIGLLANGRLEQEEISRITEIICLAYQDPQAYLNSEAGEEYTWLLEVDPEGIATWSIGSELFDLLLRSDKIDEFHEQVQDEFPGGPIPDFPHNHFSSSDEYFIWINKILKGIPPGHQLISFGDSYGDDLQGIIVNRADTSRIMALCQVLNIKSSVSFY
ncbi:hypothetical protein [Pedobacter steynii]|uniref:Uncharacterized protein n=1 Tax=Pedobacter steynii TaxID=430522 RepID=A0A1D7QJU7_9SPHI|nr:hypothetical protein [Pedobacter steynii]AOM78947.1 hypothetical protein BFS30_18295 [Pedobacter steynii]